MGKRLTIQRRAVLLYMLHSFTATTAKDVYHALKTDMPNITLSTVYTSLRFLVKMGVLEEHVHHDAPNQFVCVVPASSLDLQEVM
ncbi:transcriptional repressor [Brevibacillus brevis]|uniref:Transcriptional repressor n=1 Tax=Brevibacillus brevis TaxID=1393 RepID=A0ABY9T2A4_BREBE|nr:transcriptional repressor [Brevibacillus brevis]WNC13619.1 transcriptional repressor [Brevibacillus brevis]